MRIGVDFLASEQLAMTSVVFDSTMWPHYLFGHMYITVSPVRNEE